MVLLDSAAVRCVQSWLGEPRGPGLLDLYQAVADHRRGLWGDDARAPRSVLLIREGNGQLEAFGAGNPEPAVAWLVRKAGQTVALLAPRDWWDDIGRRVRTIERAEVLTLSAEPADLVPITTAVATRRMTLEDSKAFDGPDDTPKWALQSWTSFEDLIEHGAGFVVPFGEGAAALAWTYAQAECFEAIGVWTTPRLRRLGLAKGVASTLVSHIVHERGKIPLWTTAGDNTASRALAESLGFSVVTTQTILRWCPASGSSRKMTNG